MKILIVDDDTGILNALRIGLTGFGYEVVVAENGDNIIREEARDLGGCEYIDKPFGLKDILKVIRDFESAA